MLPSSVRVYFNVVNYLLFSCILKTTSFVIRPITESQQTAIKGDVDSWNWINPCDGQKRWHGNTRATPQTVNAFRISHDAEVRKDSAQYLTSCLRKLATEYSLFHTSIVEQLNCGPPSIEYSDTLYSRKQALEQVANITRTVYRMAELMRNSGYDMLQSIQNDAFRLFINSTFGIRTLLCIVSSNEPEESRRIDVVPTPLGPDCQSDMEFQRTQCICDNAVMATKILNGTIRGVH